MSDGTGSDKMAGSASNAVKQEVNATPFADTSSSTKASGPPASTTGGAHRDNPSATGTSTAQPRRRQRSNTSAKRAGGKKQGSGVGDARAAGGAGRASQGSNAAARYGADGGQSAAQGAVSGFLMASLGDLGSIGDIMKKKLDEENAAGEIEGAKSGVNGSKKKRKRRKRRTSDRLASVDGEGMEEEVGDDVPPSQMMGAQRVGNKSGRPPSLRLPPQGAKLGMSGAGGTAPMDGSVGTVLKGPVKPLGLDLKASLGAQSNASVNASTGGFGGSAILSSRVASSGPPPPSIPARMSSTSRRGSNGAAGEASKGDVPALPSLGTLLSLEGSTALRKPLPSSRGKPLAVTPMSDVHATAGEPIRLSVSSNVSSIGTPTPTEGNLAASGGAITRRAPAWRARRASANSAMRWKLHWQRQVVVLMARLWEDR